MSFFHRLFHCLCLIFSVLKSTMEGILILALLDVIIIEHIFSKILKNVSLKVLCKENPPSWNLKKWDSKKFIQKINKQKNVQVFKD